MLAFKHKVDTNKKDEMFIVELLKDFECFYQGFAITLDKFNNVVTIEISNLNVISHDL